MIEQYIIIVDDDPEDLEICELAREKLSSKIKFVYINKSQELIPFLRTAKRSPLFIISDVNMPVLDAFELRRQMLADPELRYKSTPFIFWSTSPSENNVRMAFDNLVQGFFDKPGTLHELCKLLDGIIYYWSKSQHPKPV